MKELFENLDYATIKGVGEDEVLVTFNGEDYEIKLTDTTRTPIFEAVEQGIYIVPFNSATKELLIEVNTEVMKEYFPEVFMKELDGAANFDPEEFEKENEND
jgi:hypothetical protein